MTAPRVTLREVEDGDLAVFWEQLTDPVLQQVAAVTRSYHYDRLAFDRHWDVVRTDPAVLLRTVLADDVVVGHVAAFGTTEEREVTYTLGREHWGRGIATTALHALLDLETTRPLHADAAADNTGSLRVLEKAGFLVTGHSRCFAEARACEIDLVLLTLA